MRFLTKLFYGRWMLNALSLKNIFTRGFRRGYYSQSGEDIIISRFLGKKKGFYVDVGAYHPKHYSNTYLLYKKGWNGINIDPNPDSIRLFNISRRKDVNLSTGVSSTDKKLIYYKFSHSSCNTFSREQAEELRRKNWIIFLGEEMVHCKSLKEIFEQYIPSGKEIDLLDVDVEGLDLDVLESNDWDKYRPRVIVVESREFDAEQPDKDEMYKFLKSRSYSLKAFTGLSLIFVLDTQNEDDGE